MNDVLDLSKLDNRDKILEFEKILGSSPDSKTGEELDKMCPLKHTFVDGAYVREIFMPKGTVITSKIHKICHPYFILTGKVIVATEEGVVNIEAPYSGVTPAGTKRVIHVLEDCRWVTVHTNPDNTQDLGEIESRIIAKSFEEIEGPKNKEITND